jgi:hypothetical protein
MADLTRSTIYVDVTGRTRQTIVRGNATLAAVQAAVLGVSNADYQKAWEGSTIINGAPIPLPSQYQSVPDAAVLTFATALPSLVYLTIPAPQAAIFLADQETVDPTKIAVLAAAVIGTVIDSSGNVVTSYIGGVRRRQSKEYQ